MRVRGARAHEPRRRERHARKRLPRAVERTAEERPGIAREAESLGATEAREELIHRGRELCVMGCAACVMIRLGVMAVTRRGDVASLRTGPLVGRDLDPHEHAVFALDADRGVRAPVGRVARRACAAGCTV